MIRRSDYRDLAIFTIVQDEPEFIHPWINHYKRHVAEPCDIHVLVHAATYRERPAEETGAMTAWQQAEPLIDRHHGVSRLSVHHASAFDHRWLVDTVSRFQSFLLQSYEWVLFAEIDEFVLPTPQQPRPNSTLLDYVRALDIDPPSAVRVTGYEIVQQDGEPPVPSQSYADGSNAALSIGDLIADRKWWYPSRAFSKTLLSNAPIQWNAGFHVVAGFAHDISNAEPSPSLTLLHLHRVDVDLALRRLRRSRARTWSQHDITTGFGWQNRADDEHFRAFWKMDSDTSQPLQPGRLASIPAVVHQALS